MRILLGLLAAFWLVAAAEAQFIPRMPPPTCTIAAGLDACGCPPLGTCVGGELVTVTDAASETDCTTGGGSSLAVCCQPPTPGTWAVCGGGGGTSEVSTSSVAVVRVSTDCTGIPTPCFTSPQAAVTSVESTAPNGIKVVVFGPGDYAIASPPLLVSNAGTGSTWLTTRFVTNPIVGASAVTILREEDGANTSASAVVEFQENGGIVGFEIFHGNDSGDSGLRLNSSAIVRFYALNLGFESSLRAPSQHHVDINDTGFSHLTFRHVDHLSANTGTCDDTSSLVRIADGLEIEYEYFWARMLGACGAGAGAKTPMFEVDSFPSGYIGNGIVAIAQDSDFRIFRVVGDDHVAVHLDVRNLGVLDSSSTAGFIHVTPAADATPSTIQIDGLSGLQNLDLSLDDWGGVVPSGTLFEGGVRGLFPYTYLNSVPTSGNCWRHEGNGAPLACTDARTEWRNATPIYLTRIRGALAEAVASGKGCDFEVLVNGSVVGSALTTGVAGMENAGDVSAASILKYVAAGSKIQLRMENSATDLCDALSRMNIQVMGADL